MTTPTQGTPKGATAKQVDDPKQKTRAARLEGIVDDLKEEMASADKKDRLIAALKLAQLKSIKFKAGAAQAAKDGGRALKANPFDLKDGLAQVERKDAEKQIRAKIANQQGGFVSAVGPGLMKVPVTMLGQDVFVMKKGTTLDDAGAHAGKRADGTSVNCYIVPETGFRVVKETSSLAGWVSKNADLYLVRSIGAGGAYDKARSAKTRAGDQAFGAAAGPRANDNNDDLTGQQRGLPSLDGNWDGPDPTDHVARIAVQKGPFTALVTESDQYDVYSQGTLILGLLKKAAAAGVHQAQEVLDTGGDDGPGDHVEKAAKVLEKAWKKQSAIKKVLGVQMEKELEPFVELVFSWQGVKTSVDTGTPGYADCTDVIMIGEDRYEGVKIGTLHLS